MGKRELCEIASELLDIVESVRGLPEEAEDCAELCGNQWCHEHGCIPMKLRRARTVITKAQSDLPEGER